MNHQERIEAARAALEDIIDAAEEIKSALEDAVSDAEQQLEDGELYRRDLYSGAFEIMDCPGDGLSRLKGQTMDLEVFLG